MNFEKHIDRIDEIMQDTGNRLTALDAEIQSKREDIQRKRRAPNVSPARLTVLDEERKEAEAKYRQDVSAVVAEAQRAVKDTRKALENESADFAALHPEAVDNAALALLNAGIATDSDLVRLANQFGGNVTMLRLLCSHAEKLMQDSPTARNLVAQVKVFLDPEARLDVFDGAVLNAHIGADPALFNIARGAWTEHAFPKFRADMQQLNSFTFQEG